MNTMSKREWLIIELSKNDSSNSDDLTVLKNPVISKNDSGPEPIAIVGLSGSFPKCQTVEDFWKALEKGESLIEKVPKERFDVEKIYDNTGRNLNKSTTQWGGFIPDVQSFDNDFFDISEDDSKVMDPRQRLLLMSVYHCIEDAGYSKTHLEKSNTAVYIGAEENEYLQKLIENKVDVGDGFSQASNMVANQISWFFDWLGPSEMINTLCSSGAIAIHKAVQGIRNGEFDQAVAGAANVIIQESPFVILSRSGQMSPSPLIRSFGKSCAGYQRADGVASIFLKSLKKAELDGDSIYAVIKNSAENYNGRGGVSMAAPNTHSHAALIKECYRQVEVDSNDVTYIEAQGMGNQVSDIAEWNAFNKALSQLSKNRFSPNTCSVSTLKPMIGHMHSASAFGALFKIIRSFQIEKLYGIHGFEKVNPFIDDIDQPCKLLTKNKNWGKSKKPKLAGLHSYGSGGNNGHILLEQYPISPRVARDTIYNEEKLIPTSSLFVFSGNSWGSLRAVVTKNRDFIKAKEVHLKRYSQALLKQKEHFPLRLAVLADSKKELLEKLQNYLFKTNPESYVSGNINKKDSEFIQVFTEEIVKDVLPKIIESGDLNKIAHLWVTGIEVSAQSVFKNELKGKYSLPLYPFQKKRFWYDQKDEKPEATENSDFIRQFFKKSWKVEFNESFENTSFQELGINSLQLIKLHRRLTDKFDLNVRLHEFLQYSTVKEIRGLLNQSSLITQENSFIEENIVKEYPLSEGQKGLWVLHKAVAGNSAFNLPICFSIEKEIDFQEFELACKSTLASFPILNTRIKSINGAPIQIIDPKKEFEIKEIRSNEEQKERLFKELKAEPFDLENQTLVRFYLIKTNDKTNYVFIVVHHIIFDGASLPALLKPFFTSLIQGQMINEKNHNPFHQFVKWEQEWVNSSKGVDALSFWREKLKGDLPVLRLFGVSANSHSDTFTGKNLVEEVRDDRFTQIKKYNASHGINPSSFFLSAFKWLLHIYTGYEDLVVGIPFVGRPLEEFEQVIGPFYNMVPVRTTFEKKLSGVEWGKSVQRNILEAVNYGDYPFSLIVKGLNSERTSVNSSIFQLVYNYQNQNSDEDNLPWKVKFLNEINQSGESELALWVSENKDNFLLTFKYQDHLYTQEQLQIVVDQYLTLIDQIINNPQLPLNANEIISGAQIALLNKWNKTSVEYNKETIQEFFIRSANSYPNNIAVQFEEQKFTYSELDRESEKVGLFLQSKGYGKNSLIGLCLIRSTDILLCILGVLKAGCAYLPLDPQYPLDRLNYMVADSKIPLLITNDGVGFKLNKVANKNTRLIKLQNVLEVSLGTNSKIDRREWNAKNLCYVIYTSGSTGKPKGVMIKHQSIANLMHSMSKNPGMNPGEKTLSLATYSFDMSKPELYLPLLVGGTCVLCPPKKSREPQLLIQEINRIKPEIIQLTPASLTMLFNANWKGLPGMKILCGGEAMTSLLVKAFAQNNCQVWNMFGPTETTVWSTQKEHKDGDPISVGKPLANTQVYIVNELDNLVPIGAVGELCIGGDGVALGYLNKKQLSDQKFRPNKFSGKGKVYKTGDLVRWGANGDLEFLGRSDYQVKLRGFRIELEEIESLILDQEWIHDCVVVDNDTNGVKRLISYYVSNNDSNIETVKEILKRQLPEYMVPSSFVKMEKLPLTPNGKIDRVSLKKIPFEMDPGVNKTLEVSGLEQVVKRIWEEVIGVSINNIHSGFFEIGGDSLLAVQAADKISKEFQLEFTVTKLFQYASVYECAKYLGENTEQFLSYEVKEHKEDFQEKIGVSVQREKQIPDYYDTSLALIGVSLQFPGARSVREFWDNLCNNTDSIQKYSEKELMDMGVPKDTLESKSFVPVNSNMLGKDSFDAPFFGISPKDAGYMDPQFRHLLMHSWNAIENAGYRPKDVSDSGVFITTANNFYQAHFPHFVHSDGAEPLENSDGYISWIMGQGGTIPTMISNKLGLTGPSYYVHTNCSSSLTALNSAFQNIISGDCDHAIVGGASILVSPTIGYVFQDGMNFSSDGKIRAFDKNADGMTGGEGVACLFLKKASLAVKDHDYIYSIIRGVALNNDGSNKAGYYAPGIQGQIGVIEKTLTKCNVDPRSISFIETHGTGTKLGDPIEFAALKQTYGKYLDGKDACGLGAVKTNIGHLDTTAGIAGLIKASLSLKEHKLVATLNFKEPNPELQMEKTPFYVIDKNKDWKASFPRRAAVSSFGIGGTNAHCILEETIRSAAHSKNSNAVLIIISAKNTEGLKPRIKSLRQDLNYIDKLPEFSLSNLSETLKRGRTYMPCRFGVLTISLDDLKNKFDSYLMTSNSDQKISNNEWFTFGHTIKEVNQIVNYDQEDDVDNNGDSVYAQWIRENRLQLILEKWVKGADIDFISSNELSYNKLPLSGYVFQTEDFKLPKIDWNIEGGNPIPTTEILSLKWMEVGANQTLGKGEENVEPEVLVLVGKKKQLNHYKNIQALTVHTDSDLENKIIELALDLMGQIKSGILQKKIDRKSLRIQVAIFKGEANYRFLALTGMFKSIKLEYPKFNGQIVYGFDPIYLNEKQLRKKLIQVFQLGLKASLNCIKVEKEKLYYESWEKIGYADSVSSKKNDGVEDDAYIITGGNGAIAQELIVEIFEKLPSSKFYVCGRQNQLTWKAQKKPPRAIDYFQADVAFAEQVNKWFGYLHNKIFKNSTIIHCAGTLADNYLLNKSVEEFKRVSSAKIFGTNNILTAAKKINVSKVILMSSLASVTGSAGQADYALANAYLDYVAESEVCSCFFKVTSINWPLWKNGGMKMSNNAIEKMEQTIGIQAIDTKSAMNILLNGEGASRQLILHGNQSLIKKWFAVDDIKEAPRRDSTIDDYSLEQFIALLKGVFANAIGAKIEKINIEERFENYGLDSVIVLSLNQALSKNYRDLSKTIFYEHQCLHDVANDLWEMNHKESIDWLIKNRNVFPLVNSVSTQKEKIRETHIVFSSKSKKEIAIIGVAGCYPGSNSLEEFWENLSNGKDLITEIPNDRWDIQSYFDSDKHTASSKGKMYSKWGGFIRSFADFDPLFFNISPVEAMSMDPQERLFIEYSSVVLESAGYTKSKLKGLVGNNVGVFAGITKTGFNLYGPEVWDKLTQNKPMAEPQEQEYQKGLNFFPQTSFASAANRVSWLFDFKGPSLPIDTMCSSSLTAIHEACQHVNNGECQMAIAGGVNLYLHPINYIGLCSQQMLSTDGKCKSFGEGGNGIVPGEGVGVVLLKDLTQAELEGDYIYGVIKGSSINHGGRTSGYSVPNPISQGELILSAIENSGISSEEISYVEAHGTGTELGDPIEIKGLNKAFTFKKIENNKCFLGSIKSNIGHLEAAAGIAGLTKILVQMFNNKLAPSLHADELNTKIDFKKSKLELVHSLMDWKVKRNKPLIAALSSFGAGGANAHVIVEKYQQKRNWHKVYSKENEFQFFFSAKNQESLLGYLDKFGKYLAKLKMSTTQNKGQSEFSTKLLTKSLMILGVDAEDVSLDSSFEDYNVDEIFWAKLQDFIRAELSIDLGFSQLRVCNSLDQVIDLLFKNNAFQRQEGVEVFICPLTRERIVLGDIAFTLMNGKEKYEYSLLIKANNLDKIINEISYSKKIKNFSDEKVMGMGEDLKFKGYKIIPLPTYEFSKKKYWIPNLKSSSSKQNDIVNKNIKKSSWVFVEEELAAHPHEINFDWKENTKKFLDNNIALIQKEAEGSTELSNLLDSLGKSTNEQSSSVIHRFDFESQIDEILNTSPDLIIVEVTIEMSSEFYPIEWAYKFSRGLMLQDWEKEIKIIFTYHTSDTNSYKVCDYRSLNGFLGTAQLENAKHNWQLIEFNGNQKVPTHQVIVKECIALEAVTKPLCSEGEIFQTISPFYIQHNSSGRNVLSRKEIRGSASKIKPLIKSNGNYLLAGGLGLIGKCICEEITAGFTGSLFLVGRNKLTDSNKLFLDGLEKNGGNITYFQGDITDEKSLSDIWNEIKSNGKTIHGIIHLASQIGGGLIASESFENQKSGLLAKVNGSIELDRVSSSEPLDFFLCFSSIGAYGSKGSSIYSYANSFQANFSRVRKQLEKQKRRFGKSLSVLWGPWVSDPVHASHDRARADKIIRDGFQLIEAKDFQPILSELYLLNKSCIGAFKCLNSEKVLSLLIPKKQKKELQESKLKIGLDINYENLTRHFSYDELQGLSDKEVNRLYDILEGNTKGNVKVNSTTYKTLEKIFTVLFNLDFLNSKESFQNNGMDSVSAMRFSLRIEKELKIKIESIWLLEYPTLESLSNFLDEQLQPGYSNSTGRECYPIQALS